ncbi:hypothetical protein ACC758_38820, partial [Rhizobium ruizarguesonis]
MTAEFNRQDAACVIDDPDPHEAVFPNQKVALAKCGSFGGVILPAIVYDEEFSLNLRGHLALLCRS